MPSQSPFTDGYVWLLVHTELLLKAFRFPTVAMFVQRMIPALEEDKERQTSVCLVSLTYPVASSQIGCGFGVSQQAT